MGDWIETEIGYVNFDQIAIFRAEPPLPLPDATTTFSGKPKGAPKASYGVEYCIRAAFADGVERNVWSNLSWQQAWNIQNSWREMLRKRAQGSGGVGLGFAIGF